MARPLLEPKANHTTTFHAGGSPATSILILVILAAAAVATVVVSLCTSGKNAAGHRNKKRRSSSLAPAPQEQQDNDNSNTIRNNKPQLLASLSGIGIKAAAVAKMVSWKNRRSPAPAAAGGWSDGEDEDGAAGEEEEALWKKTIILGDKCRPLEFSGHIAYDSDGSPVQAPAPAVKEDVAAGAAAQT